MNFNVNQSRAINHTNGPCIVVAGPGTGKTAVITNRIINLIKQKHAEASSILVVTFSRASANEMRERFQLLNTSSSTSSPVFGTFHSIFLKILTEAKGHFKILTDAEKEAILLSLLKTVDSNANSAQAKQLSKEISLSKTIVPGIDSNNKNSGLSTASCESPVLILGQYTQFLENNKLLDFDDILLKTYLLLINDPGVRSKWQNAFKYILIDEFQDTNELQYEAAKILAAKTNNLFVVGDDDQSIYAFRGAKGDSMKQFVTDYPDCSTIILDKNYRSYQPIINAAQKMISKNKGRFKRRIICSNIEPSNSPFETFIINAYHDRKTEYYQISLKIKQLTEEGIHFADMAILFRDNSLIASAAAYLNALDIPTYYQDRESNKNTASKVTNGVQLMTMHASKGLEFHAVFLPDVNEGIVPSKRVFDEEDSSKITHFLRELFGIKVTKKQRLALEEERRIFYVAMTRAKCHLHISYVENLRGSKALPSPFL